MTGLISTLENLVTATKVILKLVSVTVIIPNYCNHHYTDLWSIVDISLCLISYWQMICESLPSYQLTLKELSIAPSSSNLRFPHSLQLNYLPYYCARSHEYAWIIIIKFRYNRRQNMTEHKLSGCDWTPNKECMTRYRDIKTCIWILGGQLKSRYFFEIIWKVDHYFAVLGSSSIPGQERMMISDITSTLLCVPAVCQ